MGTENSFPLPSTKILETLRLGTVIPAHPLALTEQKQLDEPHQRALTRYYLAAGAGGLAVGVHTTEFKIHDPAVGLYRPVLELAIATARDWMPNSAAGDRQPVMIAGITGPTKQAVKEAATARELGYHIGLLSLGALRETNEKQLVQHAQEIAAVIPIMGFYLQPAVGGRLLSEGFWRKLSEIPNLAAIKIAPFNRYHTLEVVRAVAASGRSEEIVLYTGNDDSIVVDLLTPYEINIGAGLIKLRIVGGLLGHWAYWTKRAVEQLERIKALSGTGSIPAEMLTLAAQVTESNAAVFDPAHNFSGCIPGILYVLSKSGLVSGVKTLADERLSLGQCKKIDSIIRNYPHLTDCDYVRSHLGGWLEP